MKYAIHPVAFVAFICAATLAGQAGRLLPPQAPDDALVPLESALEAQPDDLRAGNDYRMAVIKANQYDHAIAFFQKLVAANPAAANAHLNFGFEYVDKIPVAGSITQVILANNALGEFTKSIELKPSWIGYYTRGNSYLFWPRVFKRTQLGINDLQEAFTMQQAGPKRPYYVRVYISLGDGYWKLDRVAEAVDTWKAGLVAFPGNAALQARLAAHGDELKTVIENAYDPTRRVDTSLQELWAGQ